MAHKPALTLQGATWNAERGRSRSPQAVTDALTQWTDELDLDFVLLQEVAGYHAALRKVPGFVLKVFPRAADGGDNAILVRRGLADGPGWAVNVKGGWYTTKGKWFPNRVPVTVSLGGRLRVVSVHAPVAVNWPSGRIAGPVRRIVATRKHAKRLLHLAAVRAEREPHKALLIGGDWNERAASTGLYSPTWIAKHAGMTKRPNNSIDWAMGRGCTISDLEAHGKAGSDHALRTFTVHVPAVTARVEPAKPAKPVIPVMGARALAVAREQSLRGPAFAVGMCLQRVRLAFGVGASAPDAISAWTRASAKHKVRETNPAKIPAGYPIFWSGGSEGHGHIAISAGGGKCWSTDIRRRGFFDLVPIATIHSQWGLTLLGYTTELNGKEIS